MKDSNSSVEKRVALIECIKKSFLSSRINCFQASFVFSEEIKKDESGKESGINSMAVVGVTSKNVIFSRMPKHFSRGFQRLIRLILK